MLVSARKIAAHESRLGHGALAHDIKGLVDVCSGDGNTMAVAGLPVIGLDSLI